MTVKTIETASLVVLAAAKIVTLTTGNLQSPNLKKLKPQTPNPASEP